MTREEFEQWLEDHKDEAVDQIEDDTMSLSDWIKHLGKSLKSLQIEDDDDVDDDVFEEA